MAVLTRLGLVAVLVVTIDSADNIEMNFGSSGFNGKMDAWNVRCRIFALSGHKIYNISIFKTPRIPDVTQPLAVVNDVDETPKVDPSIRQRATATGTVDLAAGPRLALYFNGSITCSDVGNFTCEFLSEGSGVKTYTYHPTGIEYSGNIEMLVRPTVVTHKVNDMVELVCSGVIGKHINGSWLWETRDNFGSTWTPLRPGLTPVDETPAESGPCLMTGNSTLKFQVQMEDDNRMYRCYFGDPEYSANFTFHVIDPCPPPVGGNTADPTTVSTPTACFCPVSATDSQASSGLSTGAAVAISVVLTFLLTLAATLAVGFLLLRHRLLPGPTTNNGTKQDGDYSGLDLSTREPPRVNNVYNHVGPYAN